MNKRCNVFIIVGFILSILPTYCVMYAFTYVVETECTYKNGAVSAEWCGDDYFHDFYNVMPFNGTETCWVNKWCSQLYETQPSIPDYYIIVMSAILEASIISFLLSMYYCKKYSEPNASSNYMELENNTSDTEMQKVYSKYDMLFKT